MALAESQFSYTVQLSYSRYWPDLSRIWVWIEQHIGHFAQDWTWSIQDDTMTYCFKTPAAAVEFTLTWL